MSAVTGRFLVTQTDDRSAVLRAVDNGRIYTVDGNPGLREEMIVVATLTAMEGIGAVWSLDEYEEYPVDVHTVDDPPPASVRAAVAEVPPGEVRRLDRPWGELHVLAVPDVSTAVADIRSDPETRSRAALLDAHRVVIRGGDGVVTVAYRRSTEA